MRISDWSSDVCSSDLRFALASQKKYDEGATAGFFDGEIAPVVVKGRKGAETIVDRDEHPRPQSTIEGLAKLPTLFEGGIVTAGNASGVNDGAAALIVGTRAAGEKAGAAPLVRIVTTAVAGVEPRVMGLGPVPAAKQVLDRAGMTTAEMDCTEPTEGLASQKTEGRRW